MHHNGHKLICITQLFHTGVGILALKETATLISFFPSNIQVVRLMWLYILPT